LSPSAKAPTAVGLYLGGVQFLFAVGWIVYVIYLPALAEQAGLPKSAVPWLLLMDQLIFVACDLAVGVWSDRAAGVLGRIGSWVLGVTLLSTVAFLALPWVAPRGSPGLFVAITALWAATSAALRAPPMTLLGRYVAKPAVPWLVSLVLLGTGIASAIGPYLGLAMKGLDPRLPFALAGLSLAAITVGMVVAERALSQRRAADGAVRVETAAPSPASLTGRDGVAPIGFLLAALLAAAAAQLHANLVAAPLYLRHAPASMLPVLLPVFWVGFNLALMPASLAVKRARWRWPPTLRSRVYCPLTAGRVLAAGTVLERDIMRLLRLGALALVSSALLIACGGSDDPPAPEKITYTKLVSFGDSFSDMGTYATPGLVAATGGGRYTVNGAGVQLWVERLAAAAKVPAPCAAQTGLNSIGPLAGFAAPVTNKPGCYDYAQGGARVTNPVGPGNLGTLPGSPSGALGQLTVPLVTQFGNHLAAVGGTYAATDLVTVLAGGNDFLIQSGIVQATVAAGGNATTAGQAAVTAMGQAGGELAAYIKSLVVGKGAKRVIVVALPDASLTPDALAQPQSSRDLLQLMAFTFNAQLQFGLQGVPEVLYVDLYTALQGWAANPGAVGISNMRIPACNAALVATALLCSPATTISGDTSKYFFADGVHPSPYGHELVAKFIIDAIVAKGWL